MSYVRPVGLMPGDTIAIVAPSSPVSVIDDIFIAKGVQFIQKLGFQVKMGSRQTLADFKTESGIAQRADDINKMFCDDSVKAIMCAIGGYSANDILPRLDYETIKKHPKIFIGFSDIAMLQSAFLAKCNMVSFYGPMLVSFAAPDVHAFTIKHFLQGLQNKDSCFIVSSDEYTDDAWYATPDLVKRSWHKNRCKTFKEGQAKGILLAANLETLVALADTPYFSPLENTILALESSGGDWRHLARDLMHLRLMGAFEKVSGLVLGRIPNFDTVFTSENKFEDMLATILQGYSFPVLYNFSFGHTSPIVTLPIGVSCILDADKKSIEIVEQSIY